MTGEQLFERLCVSLGLRPSRVMESTKRGERSPDFRVIGSDGSRFVAEVKLITPTPDEAADIARFHAGEIFASGVMPGERLRKLIGSANQQLKALINEGPGVLVVFNPEFFLRRHTDPYSILTAMRGLDTIDVHVPANPQDRPVFGALRSGGRKKMTAAHNTTTSAIMCPEEVAEGVWRVGVYHNRFAARPLPQTAVAGSDVIHFRIADDERDWVPLTAG